MSKSPQSANSWHRINDSSNTVGERGRTLINIKAVRIALPLIAALPSHFDQNSITTRSSSIVFTGLVPASKSLEETGDLLEFYYKHKLQRSK